MKEVIDMYEEYFEQLDTLKEEYLAEMVMSRGEAIDVCMSLGEQFIEHFNKVCKEGKLSKDFHHHCQEMQTWYNKVKGIKLRNTKRYIQPTNLYDWFFSCGADIEDFVEEKNIDTYEYLVNELITTDKSVSEILTAVI